MFLGIVFASWTNKWYADAAAKNGGIATAEDRLPPSFYGSVAIPIGLFWFAWTDYPSIHWISPVLAGVPFGFGFVVVFLAVTNYLVDSYTIFAASVLAANTLLRSLFGAAFPLFTPDMYDALGLHWASSIPAFAALACVPFPFIFYKYGARIRARCVYAAQAEAVMAELRAKVIQTQLVLDEKTTRQSSTDASGSDSEKELEASGPQFEPLKASRKSFAPEADDRASLARVKSKTGSLSEAADYNASPFDIDRVNTSTSLGGLELTKTRTNGSRAR